ncbi:Fungal specific transcription factor domain-containing protein isoform 2 [Cladophialophora immunda]|nr:Fungal specific transcription factor domain-containing protein isoform 1 [Cladophialophora immunda]OQV09214.1 Fungal specific transcription factor domain-containing protein isoform 2 [Cladophialophora immunda]
MQSYSLSSAPPSGPKNYVFVDEHNRHKRLKVMRACEGCRRRKIKCDSATTNTWPCAACVRLKLQCIPPAGGLDSDSGDIAPGSAGDETTGPPSYLAAPVAPGQQQAQSYAPTAPAFQLNQGNPYSYDAYVTNYQKPSFQAADKSYDSFYSDSHQFPGTVHDPYQNAAQTYAQTQYDEKPFRQERAGSSPIDQFTAEDLMEHLGQLKIGESGVAPYIRSEKSSKELDPPIQEPDPEPKIAAAFSTDAGSQIRIPPALMPSHEDAMEAFETYFNNVHPYVPVLNRGQFYNQWHDDQSSISPLILEAVFANAGRLSDDPAQGAQWLALANKHEPFFLDSPRLSNLQALLLLLKARESAPKRGYYYRSWMTCKTAITMAKDLELHQHYEIHSLGESCGSDPIECLTKTRIWQTLLVCETMVGGPQGRTDFGVDPNSVDISENPPGSEQDDYERSISRQFAYFVRNVRNIRLITDVHRKLQRKKDWALDKEFVAYNASFQKWPDELPPDLQLPLPPTGAVPNVTSHFLGNMHSHYHLAIVMLHRPQLSASQSFAADSQWRHHMSVCYNSAKILCRLQEGILANFDLTGLLVMQRGINFTIYAILTCIMIHLVALSSPDPEFNFEAKDYFVRQMRILERCVSAWPMPETEAQINALRAAFSADVNKPFELKESFPHGTPSENSRPSPVSPPSYDRQQPPMQSQGQKLVDLQQSQQQQPQQAQPGPYAAQHLGQMTRQTPYLATPPISVYTADSKPPTPMYAQNYELEQTPYSSIPSSAGGYYQQPTSATEIQWNPTPIMDQFDTAFAIPPSALAPPPSLHGGSGASPPGNMHSMQASFTSTSSPTYGTNSLPSYTPQQQQTQQHYFAAQQSQSYQDTSPQMASNSQLPMSAGTAYATTGVGGAAMLVTPQQWQQSVANVIDASRLKRRWDYTQQ